MMENIAPLCFGEKKGFSTMDMILMTSCHGAMASIMLNGATASIKMLTHD
jgi:hypothetical protein